MNPFIKRIAFLVLAGILLIAACAPAPVAPTQDPAEVQRQIQDSVALTVAAQKAEQAQAITAEPTNTQLPTQTLPGPATSTPLIPTATPFVVVPSTLAPGGGGGSPVKAEYSCDIIRQRPYDNSYWKPGKSFDVKWTIVNTGTKSWVAGLDVKYLSGPSMTKTTRLQLPAMAPGDQYQIVLDATTPATEGFHVMTWVIDGGFCFPYIAINVEN
jgi:hypothetical protein